MTPEMWAEIRRLHLVEKLSVREIARTLGINRKTVHRALKRQHAPQPPARPRASLLDSFQKDIEEVLAEYPDITAVRMLEELERRGFKGKYTIVKVHLARMRERRQREAFNRLHFHPGEAAQVDWMKCGSILHGGKLRHVSGFVMTLCFSRMMYVEFTVTEAFEEFLRCHVNAFSFFGGVTRKILYDNLKSVVLAHEGDETRLNSRFADFAGFYLFKPIACAKGKGNEKGRVERGIRYVRTNFLEGRKFRSLDEMNAAVVEWRDQKANRRVHKITGRRPVDLFPDDRARFRALPDASYDTRITRSVKITSDCRATFENNTYSVPPRCVGEDLILKASPTEVSIYDGATLVARHSRSHESYQDILDPDHAKAVLERKRRASGQTLQRLFLALAPEAEKYLSGLVKSELSVERHLRRILDLVAAYGKAEVMGAILRCLEYGAYGADYVENLIHTERRRRRESEMTPLQIQKKELADIDLPEAGLDHYDDLLKTEQPPPAEEKQP